MAKLDNDKYYTPVWLAEKCGKLFTEHIDMDEVTEVIEPSVGDGSFLYLDSIYVDRAFDIEPETDDERVMTADYIELDLPYLKGRATIGNPPFGSRMSLAQKFFKKAVKTGDYVAFVLPISQLWNTQSLYEFDLVHSEDLGEQDYSGRNLHCCFNIFRRPEHGGENDRPKSNLRHVRFIRNDSTGYDEAEFDVRVCLWGESTGKILSDDEHYAAEYKIKVDDALPNHDEVVDFIRTHDWRTEIRCIAMRKLQKFHFVNAILRKFPQL